LTGRILDADGQPLANARADLVFGKKKGLPANLQFVLSSARTDKEGRFTIEGLLPETGLILLVGVSEKEGDLGRTIHSVNDVALKEGEAKDLGDVKTQYKKKPEGEK
jgi:hypothetical protein